MIHVDKPPGSRPAALDKKDKDGKTELQRAKAFFRKRANAAAKFKFEAYGEDQVRDALNGLFHFKCAYCESSYGATQPVAVEHYRPKGEVTTPAGTLKPGYYWLAAEWENLLPSCTDCNSERYHKLEDGSEIKYGKANLFPIDGPWPPRLTPGGEAKEKALLLHPCHEHPEQHLVFLDDGVVQPALDPAGGEDPKAKASIPVYGLQRPQLVQARKERRFELEPHLADLTSTLQKIQADPGNAALKQDFAKFSGRVKPYLKEKSPYSAMARQAVARALAPFGLSVDTLGA